MTWWTTPTARRSPPPATGCSAALDAERYLAALADAEGQEKTEVVTA